MKLFKVILFILIFFCSMVGSAQDPNFFIFLCFGQSNMEGQGAIENQDKTVGSRFQVMQAVDCSNLDRTKGSWYPAIPPLSRCWNGLSPADYFGRTLIEDLPSHIKVGVINVSVGGCRIELFDKDIYQDYTNTYTEDWFQNIITTYEGNPYAYLLDLAKQAQKDGVIKGILLHQGESNAGDSQWPAKVKKIYENLITDLELNPTEVPLLAGELVHEDQGGVVAGMNSIIATLPETLPNSYIISSSGCTPKDDKVHFNADGYRELGKRYGEKMLTLLEYDAEVLLGVNDANTPNGYFLSQNYPNPVTGGAFISFKVPVHSHVSIKVYDMLGSEVTVIVDARFTPGDYTVDYDFKDLPKGLYIYTMRAGDYATSRKVVIR